MSREQRMGEIKEMLCDILEIEPTEMTETSRFKEDHNADSLRAIEILASLEKKYRVEIPQAELGKMTSLQAVYDIVDARTSARAT
jgi:acyl carrier protein